MTKEQIAELALQEAKNVSKAFGFEKDKVHYFKIHDQDAENNIELGIKLASLIIPNTERIIIPSDHNNHNDHQATHIIAKETAKLLSLKDTEFYVYALYNVLKAPRDKQIKIKVAKYQDELYELMKGYKTQICLKDTRMGWKALKRRRSERFGVFSYDDMNKYENF